jgi:oligopeptide transport system substrate-binding protein
VEVLAFPLTAELCDPVVGQWKDNLGVEVYWHGLTWAEHMDRVFSAPPPIFEMGWSADYPDPDNFLRVAVQLHTAWHDQHYFEAIELARRTLDQPERMKLYGQAQRTLAQEVPLLPLTYDRLHLLIKPWVKQFTVSALGNTFWKDVVLEPH